MLTSRILAEAKVRDVFLLLRVVPKTSHKKLIEASPPSDAQSLPYRSQRTQPTGEFS